MKWATIREITEIEADKRSPNPNALRRWWVTLMVWWENLGNG